MTYTKISFCTALISILLAISFLNACKSEPPIVIGATMSETGAYNTQGLAAKNGYLLCQDHINEQGGILGREVEFLIYDDRSETESAISLYEKLITEDGVDLIMGPYGSTLTEAVAPVTERHRMVHISPLAATTSIWEQGREYLFMVLPPAELFLAGLIEMAHDRGLTRVGIIQQDELFPRAAGNGAVALAVEKGMDVVFMETYPTGTSDFSGILSQAEQEGVEVLAMAASPLDDFISVVRQMKEMDLNVQMFGTSGAVSRFGDELGTDAEYAYGLSAWEPGLPYPGIDEFVTAYESKFNMSPSFHAAGAYGSCMIFREAIELAGSLDAEAIRTVLLNLETQTIFGNYAVDERGYQIANDGLFIQWQDGDKVIVWPDNVAEAEPRFPTPPWSER
jgi:branched-chain amino acid transport system substrate-binding protein